MKRKTQGRHSAGSPAVFDMRSNTCVWSKAGVIKPTRCINAFDCLSCPLHKRLKKDVASGRLKNGRAPMDWRAFPDRFRTEAEQMKCRHMLSGRVSYKYCINNYQCDTCPYNEMIENESLADFQDHSVQKIVSGFALAESYYYHPGHTWARVEYGGFVRTGLDDFSARLFGPFDRIVLPGMGTAIRQGEACCELIRGSLQAECLCPTEGVVVAVNPKASGKDSFPEWEPFDDGWLMVIEPVHLSSRLHRLYFGEESRTWLEQEAEALTAIIAEESGHALAATGGRAMPDIYGHLPELDWHELKHKFLRT
ncbi:MAG: glycine cleavage system protein H [Desulfobacterales bacterium]|nr:glycine cleavage system protein H [Desulfobacterales bacterium]MBS3754989.1 glycine cleavage system protein H [Desulfobacterales bacterium]